MDGGFPIDLVLFGLVAAFLVLRLVSILGKRTGFEQPAERVVPEAVARAGTGMAPPVIDAVAEPIPPSTRVIPDPSSQVGQTLAAMANIDRNFSPQRFLDGAEAAFRIIVKAFAEGSRTTLHPLLTSETYAAFEGAIAAREAEGHVQRTDINSIENITITNAELHGTLATIAVRIVSDQVNLTVDAHGVPVSGTDAVTEMTEVWGFERDLAQSDPAWRLVAAHSA
jgi:predicted lipid-binding transport protein (Tim44 family)